MRHIKEDPEVSAGRIDDWRGSGAILSTNSSNFQYVQEQARYLCDNAVNIGDKIDYAQRKN